MNEKIKELAEQAGWVNWNGNDDWINLDAAERGYFILADLEKFARVIIAECHREIGENSW
jgi:hypothetical protein